MNERIKELWTHAEQRCVDDEGTVWTNTISKTREKFAELIVKECVGLVNEHQQHNNPNDSLLALKIKEHFGVEE